MGAGERWQWAAAADASIAARIERARFAGALFTIGALLVLIALVVVPGWPADQLGVAAAAGVAAVAGLVQIAAASVMSTLLTHATVVAGTAIIAMLEALTGGGSASVAVGMLFVWVAVFAALYFRPAVVAGYVALIAAVQMAVLVATKTPVIGPQLILTVGTCTAAALVVSIPAGRLRHRAATDMLTGLPNRAEALSLIEAGLARAKRRGRPAALFFVDLDYFKHVNDTYGHKAGDEVLIAAAHRMVGAVRVGDVVARLGGDEFVVFIESSPDATGITDVAKRLVAAIGEPIHLSDSAVRIGASIGVVASTEVDYDVDRLLSGADAAAYEAKQSGRGRYVVYDAALRAELDMRADLDRAVAGGLAAGDFVLHYQPQVELSTRQIRSVEALIRWQRPGHGLIPPDAFLPSIEATGLINEVGAWVLTEATAQLARWDREIGCTGLRVAVNISGRHLVGEKLPADVAGALAASGIDPARLVIEVTETVLVDNPTALANIGILHEMGVSISVDDFGTGFASIGQLLTMPIDELKIDRSFITTTDETRWPLVQLMAHAAHTLGARIVAEGIETGQMIGDLAAEGIEYGQGYFFARPQPADAISALISSVSVSGLRG